jgi:N-acetylglucosamine-6-sulfatase
MGVARKLGGAALATAAVVGLALGGSSPAAAQQANERPNVVVIMSDDQTQDSIRYMPRVQELIGAEGATFPTNVTNWPLCCPSRATFLTGQYVHNHGVFGNGPPLGGFSRLNSSETLPVWLQRSGYYTAQIGKYLNGYENSPVGVPPGWSEWHGTKRTYTYYGEQLLEEGQLNTYGSLDEDPDNPAAPQNYSTDLYTNKAVDVIAREAPEQRPFFLYLAYLAPHGGGPNPDQPNQSRCNSTAKPAARHIGAFGSEPLPQPPNFNEADISDKPSGLAERPPLTAQQIRNATRNYRCRAESLLAIDEGVERVINQLRASGELDNTLVIYTSDNGFFHGEHRIQTGKNRVYEEAIRVPLLMRGPEIPKGVASSEISTNADLAPTILDATGAEAPFATDGRSLLGASKHPARMRGRELLVEQGASDDDEDGTANGVNYNAIRNARYTYVENPGGETELYDLATDPYQLANQHANPAYLEVEAALAARLAALQACAGPSCRAKPALKLKLPRSVRRNGRSCRRPSNFIARVRGPEASQIVKVLYRVGAKRDGRGGDDTFKRKIRPRLLRGKSRPEIRAIVDFIDGRKASLQKRVRICR